MRWLFLLAQQQLPTLERVSLDGELSLPAKAALELAQLGRARPTLALVHEQAPALPSLGGEAWRQLHGAS